MVRFAAWLAAIIYAANPNLIYLQATAMTEPLYLALFIWAVVYFSEFVRQWRARDDVSHASSAALQVRFLPCRRVPDPLRRMVSGGGDRRCRLSSGCSGLNKFRNRTYRKDSTPRPIAF